MNVIGIMEGEPRELNQGGTGTSAIVFSIDGTTPILLRFPSAEQLASANGGGSALIRVTAWGRVTGGTTTNYTATLQFGTSITSTSNTTIEASTARAVDSANHQWMIQATGIIDKTSNKFQGFGSSMVANLVDAVAALNAVATPDPDSGSAQAFVVAGTFSSGHASNLAYLDGFTLERLGG